MKKFKRINIYRIFLCLFILLFSAQPIKGSVILKHKELREGTLKVIESIFGTKNLLFNDKFVTLIHSGKEVSTKPIVIENGALVRLIIDINIDALGYNPKQNNLLIAVLVDGNDKPLVFTHLFGPSSPSYSKHYVLRFDTNFTSGVGCEMKGSNKLVIVAKADNTVYYFSTKPIKFSLNSSVCS